jgi:hypothetical protein
LIGLSAFLADLRSAPPAAASSRLPWLPRGGCGRAELLAVGRYRPGLEHGAGLFGRLLIIR